MAIAHLALIVAISVALLGTFTSAIFAGMVAYAAWKFPTRRYPAPAEPFLPPVSVLKPLHGPEPGLEERLASLFEQQYPKFEILFCARHASDAGLLTARRVAERYPHVPARFLTCGEPPWPNPRTYSLEVMRRAASYELLVTSDSDVLVGPDYLQAVVEPFHDPEVGLVTCIYRGVTKHGFWARLEALGMSIEMTSGVVVAEMLEGMKFALGPSMAMRQSTVEKIGGFAQVAQYHADDFVLGNWAARAGDTVVLSRYVIEHHILNPTFRSSVQHQQGWATSTRFSRPAGHIGSVLTFAVPYGLLGLLAGLALHQAVLGFTLLALAVVNRLALCWIVGGRVVLDPAALRFAWLYPLRDLLGFWFWTASLFKSRVGYRGSPYRLSRQGRMELLGSR